MHAYLYTNAFCLLVDGSWRNKAVLCLTDFYIIILLPLHGLFTVTNVMTDDLKNISFKKKYKNLMYAQFR